VQGEIFLGEWRKIGKKLPAAEKFFVGDFSALLYIKMRLPLKLCINMQRLSKIFVYKFYIKMHFLF